MFSFFKWRRCRNNNNNSPSKRKDMLKHCRKPSTSLNSSGRSKKEVSQQLMLFCFNKIIHTILQMYLWMFLMDKQQVTVVIVFVTVNVPHASLWCKFLWQAWDNCKSATFKIHATTYIFCCPHILKDFCMLLPLWFPFEILFSTYLSGPEIVTNENEY